LARCVNVLGEKITSTNLLQNDDDNGAQGQLNVTHPNGGRIFDFCLENFFEIDSRESTHQAGKNHSNETDD
jgi:hypothetical protein